MTPQLTILKGEQHAAMNDFKPWLEEVSLIYSLHAKEHQYYPFHDDEPAAVSLLVGGAARINYLAIAECRIERLKGLMIDQLSRRGTLDLWMVTTNAEYWLEFKRTDFTPFGWGSNGWSLEKSLNGAKAQAGNLANVGHGIQVAAVISAVNEMTDEYRNEYARFANTEMVDLAFRIGPDDECGAFLFFHIVDKNKCSTKFS